MVASLAIVMASAHSTTEAQGAGQTVDAPFVVKGPGGKRILEVRASASADQNQLILYNANEQVAAVMMTLDGGGFIAAGQGGSIGGQAGFRAALYADKDGHGALALADSGGKRLVDINRGPKGGQGLIAYYPGTNKAAVEAFANSTVAKIAVRDSNNDASGVGVAAGRDGEFWLTDRTGSALASIGGADDGPAAGGDGKKADTNAGRGLRIFNAEGAVAVQAKVDADGGGYLQVKADDDSQALLGINSATTGAQLLLTGPKADVKMHFHSQTGLFLYGDAGQPAVELTVNDRGGRFWLGDTQGSGMLEGGVTESGRGLLRAGPQIGGAVDAFGRGAADWEAACGPGGCHRGVSRRRGPIAARRCRHRSLKENALTATGRVPPVLR